MLSIASQLDRIHNHAKALESEAAAKATMHRGSRHQYSASELLMMRGEKVVEYLTGKVDASCREIVDDLSISYTNTKEVLAWLLAQKRIRVSRTTAQSRRFFEVIPK